MLLHGIGGWQNCLYSGCTILALPSFRNRIPAIVDEPWSLDCVSEESYGEEHPANGIHASYYCCPASIDAVR